jgi:hypothetical protein
MMPPKSGSIVTGGRNTKRPRDAAKRYSKMSVPRELLDQLLTGYLDDALSDDERARVEQLLQSDPKIVNELSQLGDMRQTLKAVAKADAVISLDKGFSDRVIGAAVARARAEGLGDDHPLVRLAEQPSTTRTSGHAAPWGAAGVMVAIAASIMIAVIVLRPPADDEMLIAEANPNLVETDPTVAPENVVVAPDVVIEGDVVIEAPGPVVPEEMIASSSSQPTVETPREVSPPETPSLESIAGSPEALQELLEQAAALEGRENFVFVLDVRLTKEGRESDAVRKAMEFASIARPSKKDVTDELAAFAKEAVEPGADSEEATVLYLQSTAQKLDQFYLTLQDNFAGVASLRLALPVDKSIQVAVEAVAVEARLVRHNEATLALFSETDVIDRFAQRLDQLPYFAMKRAGENKLPQLVPLKNDVDIPAQMLVLIR